MSNGTEEGTTGLTPQSEPGGTPAGTGETAGLQPGGEQGVLTLTREQLGQMVRDAVQPLLHQAEDRGRRQMQSIKDREVAQRTRQYQDQLQSLHGLYSSRVRSLGGGEEELAAVRQAFDSQAREQTRDTELSYYRDYYERQQAFDQTQQTISQVLALAGVPRDDPNLVLDRTEEEFFASVKKVQELRAQAATQGGGEPGAPGTPQTPGSKDTLPSGSLRVQTGAADVLAGGAGTVIGTNPIADVNDPTELLKMGLKKAKPRTR